MELVTVDDQTIFEEGTEIHTETVYTEEAITDEDGNSGDMVIQHMDISEPLTTLRRLLEERLDMKLANYEFYLQDVIPLDPGKNLVSQCVQGTGMVQINVEVKTPTNARPRLNIVDILKPAEEVSEEVRAAASRAAGPLCPNTKKVVIPFPEENENVTRWIVDQNFRREQEQLGIPLDPGLWNEAHVKHWIAWAIQEFQLYGVNIDKFNITGQKLCSLKHEEYTKLIPNDKGDVFWTHLELLRKCKFVAVIQQPTPHAITTITVTTSDAKYNSSGRANKTVGKGRSRGQRGSEDYWQQPGTTRPRTIAVPHTERIISGNRKGNNGQIQLWQFLLELLTDKECLEIIHWVGEEGEFKLNNPEMVAQLWGTRKNKPSMNYEKLSRALRYYYDGDMIAKVHGKRFVYKFVCDLRQLLGYSACELKRLVQECAEKNMINVTETVNRQHHANPRPIILASSSNHVRNKWPE